MAWVYEQTEPELWTVGHYDPAGRWHTDSDHDTDTAAADRVRWLNGDPDAADDADAYRELRDQIIATMADPDAWDDDVAEVAILARYVQHLAADRATVRRSIAAELADLIHDMPRELGGEGWAALERRAAEAGYPADWVRRRRMRGDFTTTTIEAAYQHGYRAAATVVEAESRLHTDAVSVPRVDQVG